MVSGFRSLFGMMIILSVLLVPLTSMNPANALLTGSSLSSPSVTSGTSTTDLNSTTFTNGTTTSGSLSGSNIAGVQYPNETISVNASSSVAGVKAFGNGTITTSVNGISMSFFFDPNGPVKTKQSGTALSLTVNTADLSGNSITGMYIELQDSTGKDIHTGYSPVTFSITSGQQYIVYANGYQSTVFNHWDDGSTSPARSITTTQSTTLTAYYSTGGTTTAVPQPPSGLVATAVSTSQINLSWTAPSNNGGSAITGYKIERSTNSGSTWSTLVANTGSTSTTFSDTGLSASTTYTYRVSSINSVGTSQPSNMSSATTSSGGDPSTGGSITITKVQSGLVASDSLTNETLTQQQLQANPGYWNYDGDAPAEKAPYSFYRDTSGLHIGMQAPRSGTWAGFFAESPNHNAQLWSSVITNPVRTIPTQYYENGMYVQTANGLINYVTCSTLTNNQATVWTIISTTGNTRQATGYDVLWMDNSGNQPLTRDCTMVTNGDNYLKVYLDGVMVYSSNTLKLQMPAPFNAYLEPETSYAGQMLIGTFTNYYVALGENVQVTGLPSNAAHVDIVNGGGTVLATSQVSSGTATLNVGQYAFPLSANIKVYDSNNNLMASNPENISGGDVYSGSS